MSIGIALLIGLATLGGAAIIIRLTGGVGSSSANLPQKSWIGAEGGNPPKRRMK